MNEARRLAYLSAMGIDSYVLRDNSGTSESAPAGLTEVLSSADAELQLASDRSTADVLNDATLQDFHRTQLAIKESAQEQATLAAAERSVEESVNSDVEVEIGQLRFSLQFFSIEERFAVINEIPFMGADRKNNQRSSLLLAILRAVGIELTEAPKPERFNWPLTAEDDANEQRAPEAYQALEGFMRKRLERNRYQVLLVFAGQLDELFQRSAMNKFFETACVEVIYTNSLDAMLQVPALKRSVWQDIQPVRATLAI